MSKIVKSSNLRFFINGFDGVDGSGGSGDVDCGDSNVVVFNSDDDSDNPSFVECIFLQCCSKLSFLENDLLQIVHLDMLTP